MKTRLIFGVLTFCTLLVLTGCIMHRCTITDWDKSGQTLTVDYRFTNLGDVDIYSYTICVNVKYNGGQTLAHTEPVTYTVGDGVIHWGSFSFTLPSDVTTIEDVVLVSSSVTSHE